MERKERETGGKSTGKIPAEETRVEKQKIEKQKTEEWQTEKKEAEKQEAVRKFREAVAAKLRGEELEDLLWDAFRQFEGDAFYTAKKLEYTYTIKGNEMFVSRKDKSITRATVILAFYTALRIQESGGAVTGPKKLGTFGASYLYPVFIKIGIIPCNPVSEGAKDLLTPTSF